MRWCRHWLALVALVAGVSGLAACGRTSANESGSVAIRLVPASPALEFDDKEVLVGLNPAVPADAWTPEAPARFSRLAFGQEYTVELPGRFLFANTRLVPHCCGITEVSVPVIPLTPIDSLERFGGRWERSVSGQFLLIDASVEGDQWGLEWRKRGLVVRRERIPRDLKGLAQRVTQNWQMEGLHREADDGRFDQAVLLVGESASHAEVLALVQAVTTATRTVILSDWVPADVFGIKEVRRVQTVTRPAYTLRVARRSQASRMPPLPRRPRTQPIERAGKIELDDLSVSVPEERKRIEQVAEALKPDLHQCYAPARRRNPNLQGRVGVRLEVGVDGYVDASNAGSDLPDWQMGQCVIQAFRRLHMDAVGGHFTATVALDFGPSDSPLTDEPREP